MDVSVQSLVLGDHRKSAPNDSEEDQQHHGEPWNSAFSLPSQAQKRSIRSDTNGVPVINDLVSNLAIHVDLP